MTPPGTDEPSATAGAVQAAGSDRGQPGMPGMIVIDGRARCDPGGRGPPRTTSYAQPPPGNPLPAAQIGGSGATPHIRHQSRTVSGFSPADMALDFRSFAVSRDERGQFLVLGPA